MKINYIDPTKEDIMQYLQSKGFETKEVNSQIVTNKCPFCQDAEIDWTHFYLDLKGRYCCHKCGARGNLIVLAKHFGDYDVKNLKPQSAGNLDIPVKTPKELKRNAPKTLPQPLNKDLKKMKDSVEIYHQTLINCFKEKPNSLVRRVYDYLITERGFSINTLKHFQIGWTGQSISIPYFEKGNVVNIRFRKNPFDKNDKIPKMYNTAGGKMTLFNGDIISQTNTIVITEGEFDAMTLYQEGWKNVISISCGANTFKQEWAEMLKKQATIYLCYDNDIVGIKGTEVAIDKLGAGRCYRITLPKELQEQKKDLNDFFVKDKKTIDNFHELFNKAEKVKIDYEHIKHIKEFAQETKEAMQHSGILRGLSTGYPLLDNIWSGMRKGDLIIISGDTSLGKCHTKGTKVLMHNGKVKKVEDIKVKDKLMGIDSKIRTVQRLAKGKELMYKIIPKRGAESFVVNKNHILSLKKNTKKYPHYPEYLNITIIDYLKLAKKRKHVYKLWHPNSIKFREKKLLLDPYFLGLWLGDGTSIYPCITTANKEIKSWLKKYTKKLNLQLTEKVQKNNKSNYYCLTREKKYKSFNKTHKNKYIYEVKGVKGYGNVKSMKEYLKNLNLLGNKHIPFNYKINSEKNRLALLAGLIDSDGCKQDTGYCFYNKNKQLCKDVIFIARSLGLFASTLKEKYTTCNNKRFKSYMLYISGDTKKIPLKIKRKIANKRKGNRNWLTTGFDIIKLNKKNYYGFTLDKDNLYILDNFIVNHNTFFIQNVILNLAREGLTSLLFSLEQPIDEIVERFLMLEQFDFQAEKQKNEVNAIKQLDFILDDLKNMPVYLYSGYENLHTTLLGEVAEKGVKDFGCEVLFIDHLHYFAGGDRSHRTVEIGDIIRYIKLLARKLNIPIVLVSHIRKLIQEGIIPTLDDLKDSSSIKQDADIVAILYRKRDKETRLLSKFVTINTDKNRHGKIGKVNFIFGDGKEIEYEENKGQENAKKTIKTIPLCVFEEIEYSDNETENAQNREIAKNSVDFKKVEESDINI